MEEIKNMAKNKTIEKVQNRMNKVLCHAVPRMQNKMKPVFLLSIISSNSPFNKKVYLRSCGQPHY